ncbi:hypothetical protein [Clostridium botulinum]|nr:hypothetical protein [Clostridium botulinum]
MAGYFGKQDCDDENVMYALERLKECELIDYQITEDKKLNLYQFLVCQNG